MLWRILQIIVFAAVMAAFIKYDDIGNPYVQVGVSLFCAFAVTALISEALLLPGRISRLARRLFGLKDQPRSRETGLMRPGRHPDDTGQQRSRIRIGKDPR